MGVTTENREVFEVRGHTGGIPETDTSRVTEGVRTDQLSASIISSRSHGEGVPSEGTRRG